MYEASFKFLRRPFPPTPHTGSYFPAAAIERARQTLSRIVERGDGPGLLTGPPGTGKTLVCHLLAEQFRDAFAVVLLPGGRLKSTRAMLQSILHQLRLPWRELSEGDLRLSLLDFLEPQPAGPQGLLLLVDEAHTLPWQLLDEVRLMTNLVRDGQPRVRVILSGTAVLEERFTHAKLDSFNQRLAGRCLLEGLNRRETADYVRAQIAAAGGNPAQLIDDAALATVYNVTEGVPRLINQVCDHALVLVSLAGGRRLTSEAIDEAWADLQQLPPPWTPQVEGQGTASPVVEFGSLDDGGEEAPEAIPIRGLVKPAIAESLDDRAPEEQLDAIADQLSTIEDEDEPSVTSVNGTVLDFPEFGDPFQERFAEEEVVVDPYHTGVEIFAEVPRVSSWEGRQIASVLDEIDATQPRPKEQPNVRLSEPSVASREPAEADFAPASDPVLPEEPASEPLVAARPTLEVPPPERPVVATSKPLEQLLGAAHDRNKIVLEEDAAPAAPRPAAPARKPEFRQLFAKLRRG